ncbi:hypothetical protein [Shewanella zhangzhouensis]|uniref:hypothetical protein n=1 Tax=Shewanella zhangzhouensis TaxID=2864213 RepID=UPI001C65B58B|nr:hypothetical protein [Shewanella zhangzhouensis]QYK05551.1 hypothetical protein K0H63_01465 [Shewanella zhangzhouensis]
MEIEIALENDITRGDWRIYIAPNPDRYRGGFIWSIVKDDGIWDEGLAWSTNEAESDAIAAITAIQHQSHA